MLYIYLSIKMIIIVVDILLSFIIRGKKSFYRINF